MSKAYSIDLRQRVLAHVLAGHSRRAAGRYFGVSGSFVIKLLQRYHQTGSIEPAAQGQPVGSGKLAPFHGFFIEKLEETPDITLMELSKALHDTHGVSAALASMSALLKRLGYSYKKNSGRHRTKPG